MLLLLARVSPPPASFPNYLSQFPEAQQPKSQKPGPKKGTHRPAKQDPAGNSAFVVNWAKTCQVILSGIAPKSSGPCPVFENAPCHVRSADVLAHAAWDVRKCNFRSGQGSAGPPRNFAYSPAAGGHQLKTKPRWTVKGIEFG